MIPYRRVNALIIFNIMTEDYPVVLQKLSKGFFINLFSNVPVTDKPGSWFLLAKCLKNTCKKQTGKNSVKTYQSVQKQ